MQNSSSESNEFVYLVYEMSEDSCYGCGDASFQPTLSGVYCSKEDADARAKAVFKGRVEQQKLN